MHKLLLVGVLVLAACDEAGPFGARRLYALTAEHVPATAGASTLYARDVAGDGVNVNKLGDALQLLMDYGLGDVQNATDMAVAAGAVQEVVDVQLDRHGDSLVNTFVGSADAYDPTSPSQEPLAGSSDGPFVRASAGDLPAVIAPFGVAVPVVLHGAHVELFAGPDSLTAVIAGGIDPDIVSDTLVAQWHDVIGAIVARDCPGTAPSCACAQESPGATALSYWDLDRDCMITYDELANGVIVSDFLRPDVKVDGQPVVSFGFGIDAKLVRFAD